MNKYLFSTQIQVEILSCRKSRSLSRKVQVSRFVESIGTTILRDFLIQTEEVVAIQLDINKSGTAVIVSVPNDRNIKGV